VSLSNLILDFFCLTNHFYLQTKQRYQIYQMWNSVSFDNTPSLPQHPSCYTLSRVQWVGNIVLASKIKKMQNKFTTWKFRGVALRHLRLWVSWSKPIKLIDFIINVCVPTNAQIFYLYFLCQLETRRDGRLTSLLMTFVKKILLAGLLKKFATLSTDLWPKSKNLYYAVLVILISSLLNL